MPDCPLAIVTNFGPLADAFGVPLPEKAAPLIEAGFVCEGDFSVVGARGGGDSFGEKRIDERTLIGWIVQAWR